MVNIRMIDLCGSIVGFMYNGKTRYKSTIGGALSLILLSGILSIISVYLYEFFARTKANMTFENIKHWNPPNLDISSNFNFVIMTQYNGISQFREDVLKIEGNFVQKKGTKWTKTKVTQIPCVSHDTTQRDLFNQLELYKGICFDMTGIALEGNNVNDIFKYFQISVTFCEGDACYPKDKLQELIEISKPLLVVYYLDTAFQITNVKNRIKKFLNNVDINITYQDEKETTVFFSHNEMYLDENYFFPTTSYIFDEFMIESTRDLACVRTAGSHQSIILNFVSSNKTEITSLSYTQISELLTNICALTNVIIILISSIGNFFNHYLFQSDLIHALYDIHSRGEYDSNHRKTMFDKSLMDDSNNNINNHHHQLSILKPYHTGGQAKEECKGGGKDWGKVVKGNGDVKITHLINSINLNNLSHTKVNRSDNIPLSTTDQSGFGIKTDLFSNKTSQDGFKRTQFSRLDIIKISILPNKCLFCKKTSEKKRMFNLISKSLAFYQDLRNVYRKMQEVDLLKYLLLTEEQLSLYQIIPRPDFKKVSDGYFVNDFSSLVNQPKFHFTKSHKEVKLALQNPEVKSLMISKMAIKGNNTNSTDEKLIKLINKQ